MSVTIKPGEITLSCVSEYCEIVNIGTYEGDYGFKWKIIYGSSTVLFEDSEIIERHSAGSDNSDSAKLKSKAYTFIAQPGYTYKTYGAEADTAPADYELLETYVCPAVTGKPTGLTNPSVFTDMTACDFSWTNDSGATHVSFLLGSNPGNMSVVLNRYEIDATTGDTITLPLEPDTTYYWQVINHNESGDTPSEVKYFSTPVSDSPSPGDISLTLPANGASDLTSVNVRLVWENSTEGYTRSVQIGRQEGVFDTVVSKTLAISTIDSAGLASDETGYNSEDTGYDREDVELLPDTVYYWRIVNHNTYGEAYSETRWFKTPKRNPYAPYNLAPDGAADSPTTERTVTLSWSDNSISGEEPEKVSLEIRPEGGSSTKLLDRAEPVNTYAAILLPNTTYYWHVTNHYSDRDVTSSDAWFTTPAADPKVPDLYSPDNRTFGVDYGSLSLYWNDNDSGGNTPDFITLQLATGNLAFEDVFSKKKVSELATETIETVEYYKWTIDVEPDTAYYWRVINHWQDGDATSAFRTFRTKEADASSAVLYTPDDQDELGSAGNTNLKWFWSNTDNDGDLDAADMPNRISLYVGTNLDQMNPVLERVPVSSLVVTENQTISGVTNTRDVYSHNIYTLADNVYYWKVVSHWPDRDSVSVTNFFLGPVTAGGGASAPTAPTLTYTPAEELPNDTINVTLTWQVAGLAAGDTAKFSVYVSKDFGSPVTVLSETNKTSSVDVEDYGEFSFSIPVSAGSVYYWFVEHHVDSLSTVSDTEVFSVDSSESSTGETPPKEPTLTPVANQANTATSVSLAWSDGATGATPDTYTVYLSRDFAAPVKVLEGASASKTVSVTVVAGSEYTWWVESHANGLTQASSVDTFTVADPDSVSAPTAPTLTYSPASELPNTTENVILTWEVDGFAAGDTAKFSVYVSKDFASPVTVLSETNKTSDATGTFLLSIPVSAGSVYYWFVEHHVDSLSMVSDTEVFSVDSSESSTGETPPKEPAVTAVANQANTETSVSLAWSDGATGATPDTYTVYLSRDFAAPVKVLEGASASKTVSVTVVAGSEYTWWVESHANGLTQASSVDTFTVADPDSVSDPARPVMTAPLDNASIAYGETSVDLQWNIGGSGTDTAEFSVYMSKNFAPLEAVFSHVELDAVAGTYTKTIAIEAGTTYYWRVDHHENGLTTSSSTFDFTVGSAPSESSTYALKPQLELPNNGSVNQAFLDTKLEWDEGLGDDAVTHVTIKIGTDSALLSTIIDEQAVADFVSAGSHDYEYTIEPPLLPDTVYYWQVTHHGAGQDNTSVVEWFKTRGTQTGRVESVTYTEATKKLTWSAPAGFPDGYYLYIGTDSIGVSNADTESDYCKGRLTDAEDTFSNAMPQTLYYWRIDAFVLLDGETPPGEAVTRGVVRTFFTGTIGFVDPPATVNSEKIVYRAGISIKYASIDGTSVTDSGITISDTDRTAMLCAFNKCFVANGTTKKVIDFTNTKFTISGTGIQDADIPQRDTMLYQDNGGDGEITTRSAAVIDYIEEGEDVSGNRIFYVYAQNVYGEITYDETDPIVSYWINEDGDRVECDIDAVSDAPNVYDWAAYPEKAQGYSDNGELPQHIDIIEIYAGQIVAASSKGSTFYMSAPNDPFNYAFYEETGSFAAAAAYTGRLGYNLTAVVPFRDDILILASRQSMWMFRGSPASGATMDNVSDETGIYNGDCWTADGAGRLYFMDRDGIYLFDGSLQNISMNAYPKLRNEFDVGKYQNISMVFDKYNNGILISGEGSGENKSLFFSLDTMGFFELSFDFCGGITSAVYDGERLLLGCEDGGVKFFDNEAVVDVNADDTEENIESEILFGPVAISQATHYTAIINTIEAVLDVDGGSIGVKVYTGQTPSEVISNYENDIHAWHSTFASGHSYRRRPRRRAGYIGVLLYNRSSDTTWAMERIIVEILQRGKLKRG